MPCLRLTMIKRFLRKLEISLDSLYSQNLRIDHKQHKIIVPNIGRNPKNFNLIKECLLTLFT